jgi:hypothetical protein
VQRKVTQVFFVHSSNKRHFPCWCTYADSHHTPSGDHNFGHQDVGSQPGGINFGGDFIKLANNCEQLNEVASGRNDVCKSVFWCGEREEWCVDECVLW